MEAPAQSRPESVRYAFADYWEARYQREPALFEWFFGHTALRRILRTYVSKKKPVLHVGCGTSNLQEGMARSGYNITNTDISEVVIQQMQKRHAQYTNMTYRVSDCRCMPEFLDCSFGHVLDKGTMDALLCCKQGTENVMRMLLEIYRVLQPGGSFLLITLGDPTRRLPLLCDARLPWKVSLLLLPKISAANQAYVDGKPINDSTSPVEAQGPFEVVDADTILDLPLGVQFSNFFFAYVCKKQPLQLPQHHGQKAQAPNGWVAGSKELFQKLQKELGLPEDLLDKGRRKRVMHVPAGQGSMHLMPGHGASSNASVTSGNSSPVLSSAQRRVSSSRSIPALSAPIGELQSALTALQLEQQLMSQQQQHQGEGAAAGAGGLLLGGDMVQRAEIPPRPQSAPNLVEIEEAEAEAAAAAAVVAAAAAAASWARSPKVQSAPGLPFMQSLQQQHQQQQQQQQQQQLAASPDARGTAAAAAVAYESAVAAASAGVVSAAEEAVGGTSSAAGQVCGVRPQPLVLPQQSPAAADAADAAGVGVVATQQLPSSGLVATSADDRVQVLVHAISGPAVLATGATQQQGQEAVRQQDLAATAAPGGGLVAMSPQHPQVLNFAAGRAGGGAAMAPAGSSSTNGDTLAQAGEAGVLQASPLPPLGNSSSSRTRQAAGSTPTSPSSTSPSHSAAGGSSSSCQQPPLWPGGLRLQQGQVLPQLQQGQHALAVSAATAAATAAGMYPHPVAPRAPRATRLRRFSTEYGALTGSALQMQLELLRLQQAQHSEIAADGLVLHDVAAGDSCGGAAAAAAVAAAAWGAVRRPRDRRLSNISILSGLSMVSSTSIDESGENMACDEAGSAAQTAVCSSEPSCFLYSPAGQQAWGLSSPGPCDLGGAGLQQEQHQQQQSELVAAAHAGSSGSAGAEVAVARPAPAPNGCAGSETLVLPPSEEQQPDVTQEQQQPPAAVQPGQEP